jgi:hypothetical protein
VLKGPTKLCDDLGDLGDLGGLCFAAADGTAIATAIAKTATIASTKPFALDPETTGISAERMTYPLHPIRLEVFTSQGRERFSEPTLALGQGSFRNSGPPELWPTRPF